MSTSSSDSLVLVERDADVVTLTFNDPKRRNAMTRAMGEAFSDRVSELAGDASIRAVVLTGAGRAFSAGGDMAMLEDLASQGERNPDLARRPIRDTMRSFYGLFLSVRDFACPTIAAINGHAIGAGFCVALACDMRFANSEAKLGLNFATLGIHPGMAATWTLPRLIGPAMAAELLHTGRIFGAPEAAVMGLVNRSVAPDEVLGVARSVAEEIARAAPIVTKGVKRALAQSLETDLEGQLEFEAREQSICFGSRDAREGLASAKEKRAPRFEGR